MRTRLLCEFVVSVLLALANVQHSLAQHADVLISVDGTQIVVQDSFYSDSVRNFDVLGDGTVWHGTSPGYLTTSAGQFKLNDEVMFNVV
ncbi:MAG: hypothetical protein KDA87_25580, partial [Planctomycetales bacterium]|nr:hypothetical protein [Planctomycetales bacterium]